MKASFFSEFWAYWAVRLLSVGLRVAPLSWALAFGRWMGTLGYWGQPKRRALALGNLKAAFGADVSPQALDTICRGVFQHLGMSFVEVLRAPAMDRATVDRWMTIQGQEHLDRALRCGRGVLFVTAHFGNWELMNLVAGLRGLPISVLVRAQGLPRLNRLLNAYRESKGCRVITKGMAVRAMVRQLRAGGIVGILADQDAGRRGALAPFFGRWASTAQGPFVLARKLGCPLLPVFIVRTGGPRHTVFFEPPLAIPSTDAMDADSHAGVTAYLQILERYIRAHPEQWLWPHRRWKSSPSKRVVAISDGKAGHRTQGAAVAGMVEEVWLERAARDSRFGGAPPAALVQRAVIDVQFRSSWRRFVLALAVALRIPHWGTAWAWLRWALTEESARALEQTWASVVVSCGASAGLVNAVWSRSHGARAIHLLRPPWPITNQVDLTIVPRHDRLPQDARTLVTHGALHAIRPEELASRAATQRARWALGRPIQLGVLIGGDSRQARLPPALVSMVLAQVLDAARRLDGEVLVTTSRRTSPAIERLVERRLDQQERCPLLVLASRDRSDGYVPGILAAASLLVVSGESISMVSEAVAAAKPVIVFAPQALVPWAKHRRFLASMAGEGLIQIVPPEQLSQRIVDVLHRSSRRSLMDDRTVVLEHLRQWL